MPRIRTIKPEFWVDEKIVDLDPWARLLFIGIWNFADDQGYIEYSPKRLKMQIFPGDPVDVCPLLASLLEPSRALLAVYDSPIGKLLHVQSWTRHQKISNAAHPRFDPADLVPLGADLEPLNLSPDPPLEDSGAVQIPRPGKERKGKEEERKGTLFPDPGGSAADAESEPRRSTRSTGDAHFDAFWEVYPRHEGKGAARKAWDRAVRRAAPKVLPEMITVAAAQYRDLPGRDPQYTKHAERWLNADCWTDERLPPARAAPNGANGRVAFQNNPPEAYDAFQNGGLYGDDPQPQPH